MKVLTVITNRESRSRPDAGWEQSCRAKLGKANARAIVGNRKLERASLYLNEEGQPLRIGEASIPARGRLVARRGSSGVKGDGACGKNRRELGRSIVGTAGWCCGHALAGMNNRGRRGEWKSERSVVAMKRVTTVERRGLGVIGAESEERAA
jgi:hypothetical protein